MLNLPNVLTLSRIAAIVQSSGDAITCADAVTMVPVER